MLGDERAMAPISRSPATFEILLGVCYGVVALFSAGENAIVIVSGANSKLSPMDVNRAAELISMAKVVICQLEVPRETTLEALKLGRHGGGERKRL